MIKLEEGKYYSTEAGKKFGPMRPSGYDEWPWIVVQGDGLCWHDDGSPVADTESPWLVAEWADTPKIWLDMTPEEKGALLLAHHKGEVIESFANDQWGWCSPTWSDHCCYRVRSPKVTLYGGEGYSGFWGFDSGSEPGEYRITFDLVDGEPDCASIKMERIDD